MNSRHEIVPSSDTEMDLACPICASADIDTSWQNHAFIYGEGDSAIELTVLLPVRHCPRCDFEYLDECGEHCKHNAVCQHLGVLPPSAIQRIREAHNMTRAAFARLTGIGEASLNRWEKGINIQTHANDRYLRLLVHPSNILQLQQLSSTIIPSNKVVIQAAHRFRSLMITDVIRKHQASFTLRNTG